MSLEFVEPTAVLGLNIMLYGPPKVGKTTAAASAPGPVLLLSGEGPNGAMYARRRQPVGHILEVAVRAPQTLLEAIEFVSEGKCKTVVLDTVGAVYQELLEYACKGGRPSVQNYGDTGMAIERFVRQMRDLPVNFVICAHEYPVKDEENGVIEKLPYAGTSNPQLGGKLMQMVDVLAYCGRQPLENGRIRYVAQLFNGAGRRGGDRTDTLGTSRELDLSEWIETYEQATRKERHDNQG